MSAFFGASSWFSFSVIIIGLDDGYLVKKLFGTKFKTFLPSNDLPDYRLICGLLLSAITTFIIDLLWLFTRADMSPVVTSCNVVTVFSKRLYQRLSRLSEAYTIDTIDQRFPNFYSHGTLLK